MPDLKIKPSFFQKTFDKFDCSFWLKHKDMEIHTPENLKLERDRRPYDPTRIKLSCLNDF